MPKKEKGRLGANKRIDIYLLKPKDDKGHLVTSFFLDDCEVNITTRRRRLLNYLDITAARSALHVVFTIVVCIPLIAAPWVLGMPSGAEWLVIIPAILFPNVVEYAVHRWIFHGPAYKVTDRLHHDYFSATDYWVRSFADLQMIVLSPLMLGILLITMVAPFTLIIYWLFGKAAAGLALATMGIYYLTMLLVHIFAHTKVDIWMFNWLRTHHHIHHTEATEGKCNYSIIPLTDMVLRTKATPKAR